MSTHLYADDIQIYLPVRSGGSTFHSSLLSCLEEVKCGLEQNHVQLNASKSEVFTQIYSDFQRLFIWLPERSKCLIKWTENTIRVIWKLPVFKNHSTTRYWHPGAWFNVNLILSLLICVFRCCPLMTSMNNIVLLCQTLQQIYELKHELLSHLLYIIIFGIFRGSDTKRNFLCFWFSPKSKKHSNRCGWVFRHQTYNHDGSWTNLWLWD